MTLFERTKKAELTLHARIATFDLLKVACHDDSANFKEHVPTERRGRGMCLPFPTGTHFVYVQYRYQRPQFVFPPVRLIKQGFQIVLGRVRSHLELTTVFVLQP